MQIVYVFAVAVALVVLLSVPETGATKHLMLAPLLWAGHIAKDAAHHLAAFKLSIATKVLAMITGNRSFRTTLEYDSRIERYQPPVESPSGYQNKVPDFHHRPARPSPVHMEKNVKVDWFPGVKFPHFSFPSLPKLSLPHISKMSHLNPFSHLSKFHLPSIPHLSHFHHKSLPQLPSINDALAAPKFASGYFNGGFKVGTGNNVQLNSGPVLPAVVVCCPVPVGGVGRSVALANSEQLGKSQPLAEANDPAVPIVTTPHGLNKSKDDNSTVDVTTSWLSVRGGSQTFPDSNGTAVPVLTSLDGFQKEKEANSSVGVATSPASNLNRTRRAVNPALENYFSFIRANDDSRCIARMVCCMAATPQEFGVYGDRVLAFFEGMDDAPVASVLVYKNAVATGKRGKNCNALYPDCKVDPKYLAYLGSTEL